LPTAYGVHQPYVVCGYTPNQLRGAYGISSVLDAGTTGAGQTVAIIDAYASPTVLQDVNQWAANRRAEGTSNLPDLNGSTFQQIVAPGTFNRPQNPKQDPQGWASEETLDIEAVHSMAPGAKIVYLGAPNNYRDMDAVLVHAIDRHVASIITNSWGYPLEELPRGFVLSIEPALVQAAATGIGVYFASGDDLDEVNTVGFATPDWPASSPWVTAVGGTSLGVGASNNYLFETGWGTRKATLTNGSWGTLPGSFLYGSGGGISCLFPRPAYQQGVVPANISEADRLCGSFAGRVVPDVSMDGDIQTGFRLGLTQAFPTGNAYSEYRIGGTSLSSPLFAALMALADQQQGSPHGFVNPLLYAHAGSSAFRDVTDPANPVAVVRVDYVNTLDASAGLTYSLRTTDQTGVLDVTPGFDDVTGIGTPHGSAFLNAIDQ
jgi:subtilase family serine protease